MVKTRSHNSKSCISTNTIITEGVVTRSQKQKYQYQYQHQHQHQHQHPPVQKALKKKELPIVELTDRVKDKIKKSTLIEKLLKEYYGKKDL